MAGIKQVQQVSLQQTLSPQMRQSLAILQAPVVELLQLVQQELQNNPVLEEEATLAADELDGEMESTEPEVEDTRMQDEWREWMVQTPGESRDFQSEERRQHFLESQTVPTTLHEYLLSQLSTASLSATQRTIGDSIIGNLNDDGFLLATPEEIALQLHVTLEAVNKVLEEIQTFDPSGVAASDLRDSLLIQLRAQGKRDSVEYRVVENYLEELGRKKFPEIARKLKLDIQKIQHAAEIIAQLDPRPGRNFSSQPDQIVQADLLVEWDGKFWQAVLNDREIPRLRISNTYKDLLSTAGNTTDLRTYLRDKIQEGKFFMRCIQQRQQTLLQIGRTIIERQQDFLKYGASQLHPMTMTEIAQVVDVHETTVSRAVAGKYISTPHGLYELKYFFSSGYNTSEGESISNRGVREMIADLVSGENPLQPLSDQQIVSLLVEKGIPIARRTVNKYREQLGILPSNLRRKF
ncbi:MAG: RNA polymerase factor sigma-54 [Chthoniobacterales bacterium]